MPKKGNKTNQSKTNNFFSFVTYLNTETPKHYKIKSKFGPILPTNLKVTDHFLKKIYYVVPLGVVKIRKLVHVTCSNLLKD